MIGVLLFWAWVMFASIVIAVLIVWACWETRRGRGEAPAGDVGIRPQQGATGGAS